MEAPHVLLSYFRPLDFPPSYLPSFSSVPLSLSGQQVAWLLLPAVVEPSASVRYFIETHRPRTFVASSRVGAIDLFHVVDREYGR